jgi:hypothetical protein
MVSETARLWVVMAQGQLQLRSKVRFVSASCGFVDQILCPEKSDPRNHTKPEKEIPDSLASSSS